MKVSWFKFATDSGDHLQRILATCASHIFFCFCMSAPHDLRPLGEWKEGKYHGNGELQYANGGKYSGEFRNSVAHGFGTEVTATGEVRRGVWEHGQPMNTSAAAGSSGSSPPEQQEAAATADGSGDGDGRPKSPPLGVD